MSDPTINRPVVSGHGLDVDAFGSAVAEPDGASPSMLSFKQLQRLSPEAEQDDLDNRVDPHGTMTPVRWLSPRQTAARVEHPE